MTKKAVIAALVGAFAFCAPASANVLPLKTAQQLAKRLAAKQVRTRQIVSLHIVKPHRVSAREIKFAYDDRSALNVYCTSVIVVKLPTSKSRTAKASFDTRATVCHGIPDEVLAFESATRAAVRNVHAQAGVVKSSVTAFVRSTAACKSLRVPRSRRAAVDLLTSAAAGRATFGPVDAQLAAFVDGLNSVRTSDAVLAGGAAGWADLLQVYRSLPNFQPNVCAAVKGWAAQHWVPSAAPADLAALKALETRALGDERAIARTSVHLANLGTFPRTALAFTPDGLAELAVGRIR
jgi:hypothetical protein